MECHPNSSTKLLVSNTCVGLEVGPTYQPKVSVFKIQMGTLLLIGTLSETDGIRI